MITLFNGHSLTVKTYFAAEAAGLQLSERQSTASLTLSNDAPALNVDDWVRFEKGPGAGIVWRVKTIDDAVEKQTRTVTLEHLIMALKDRIMFGTVKPQDITAKQSTVTAKAAMEYILKQSPDWTLGSFASAYSTVKNPYSFNSDDLYSAMETVSSSLEDCLWEYNFTAYPFKINIRKLSDDVGSEMRTDRNIRTLKKTIDRSRMYTRIYPIGKNNLHIDNDYLSKNENTYGIISHTETDSSQDTKDKLKAWAQERLNRHCVPSVTVSISGMDLHEATGEALDSFTIGKKCRVPLPEYGTTITERVTKLSYRDVIADPTDVTITLANEIVDVATILKETSSGRGARNQAKNDEEDHAWIVDTTDKVALVAEAVAGKDKDGDPNWSRVSELTVDGNGIDGRVTYTEGEVVKHESRITQTEKDITAEVKARKDEDKELSGKIQVNSDKVGMVVEVKDKKNVIKAASIVTAINDAGSTVTIEADHVLISGTTKLSGALTVEDGALKVKTSLLVSGSAAQGNVTINDGKVNAKTHQVNSGGSLIFVGSQSGEHYDITADIVKGSPEDTETSHTRGMVKSFSVSNNVLTLTPFAGDAVTFSKATDLTGAWGSGADAEKFIVTASPQGNKYKYSPPMRLNGGSPPTSNFSAEITETTGSTTVAKKSVYGYLTTRTVDTNTIVGVNTKADGSGTEVAAITVTGDYQTWYDNGWDNASGCTVPPGRADDTSVTDFTFKAPLTYSPTPGTTKREQVTYSFSMSKGQTPGHTGYATCVLSGVGTVARTEIGNWYDKGWENAAAEVTWPPEAPAGVESLTFVVRTPNSTHDSASDHTFTLTSGTPAASGYATVTLSGQSVARIQIGNWWTDGYDTAKNYVQMPEAGTGEEFSVMVPNDARTGQTEKKFIITKGQTPGTNGYASVSLSGTVVARVSIGNWWRDGYDTARDYVKMPGAGTEEEFVIKVPNSARTGQDSKKFLITKGANPGTNGYVAVSLSGTVVGRMQIGDWYQAGQNSVQIKKGSWGTGSSSGQIQFTKSAGTTSTKGVKIGLSGSWNTGVYSYEILDYYDNPQGVTTHYAGTIDIGTISCRNVELKPGSTSISGRTRAANDISKSQMSTPCYLFFDIVVRGKTQKYYLGII